MTLTKIQLQRCADTRFVDGFLAGTVLMSLVVIWLLTFGDMAP